MDGNKDAFVKHGEQGIKMVLDNPDLLLFETNHWEDSYKSLVALNIEDRVPISDAYAFQKGSEFGVHVQPLSEKDAREWCY